METDNKITAIACSGASNTGKFTDEVVRKMSANGEADMVCLAKVAIGDKTLIEKLKKESKKIFVLDGCPFDCAEKILGKEGITNIVHINTTDFGIVKGKTPFSTAKADEIIEYIKSSASELKLNSEH